MTIAVKIWLRYDGQEKGAPHIERHFDNLTNASAYAAREKRRLKKTGYVEDYGKMKASHEKGYLYLVMFPEFDGNLPEVTLIIQDIGG